MGNTMGIVPPHMRDGGKGLGKGRPPSEWEMFGNKRLGESDGTDESEPKRLRPQDRAAENDMDKVCWNFVKGFCSKGQACRWGHIIPQGYEKPAPGAKGARWQPSAEINTGGGGSFGGGPPPQMSPPQMSPPPMPFARSPEPESAQETYSGDPPSGGARVRIVGLAARPAFNNRIAVCKGKDDAANRWEVQLEDGSILRVQEKNMRVIAEEGRVDGAGGSHLSIGERVRITGLTSKPGFNNRAALCQAYDRTSMNWSVLLDDGSTLAIPEENLMPY